MLNIVPMYGEKIKHSHHRGEKQCKNITTTTGAETRTVKINPLSNTLLTSDFKETKPKIQADMIEFYNEDSKENSEKDNFESDSCFVYNYEFD